MKLYAVVAVLATARTIQAQCSGPSITVSSNSDAQAISSCKTYQGDVIISSDAVGEIALNGVQRITGDLTCVNATELSSISADQLSVIDGTFQLEGVTILSSLVFASLANVAQINWVGLPSLQGLNFGQGVSQAQRVYISNTQLNSLTGLSLTVVGSIDVNHNPYLSTITMPLTNITVAASFSANGKDLSIEMPQLQIGGNMTYRNVSNVAMPGVTQMNGALGFYDGSMQTLNFPNLTMTAESLAIVDCGVLSNLSFPKLKEVSGGLLISNNTKLKSIDLPKLQVVAGAAELTGDFSSVSLASLEDVRGGMEVNTSSTTDVCSPLQSLHNSQVIKGLFTCVYARANSGTPTVTTSLPTGTSNNDSGTSSGSSVSPGAIAGIVVGGGVVVVVALVLLTWWLCVRRKRKRALLAQQEREREIARGSELPLGHHHEKTELPADPNHVSELQGDKKHTIQRDQRKEAIIRKRELPPNAQLQDSSGRILGPHELNWDTYQPELDGVGKAPELDAMDATPEQRRQVHVPELSEGPQQAPELPNTPIRRKPVAFRVPSMSQAPPVATEHLQQGEESAGSAASQSPLLRKEDQPPNVQSWNESTERSGSRPGRRSSA